MITTQGIYDPRAGQPRTFVPLCSDAANDYLVPASCIYSLPEGGADTYTVVTGMNPDDTSAHTSTAAFLAAAGQVYVSQNNIYIACTENTMNWQPRADSPKQASDCSTIIHRLSYDKGTVAYASSGMVPGSLINQFALDEFEGHLRVATTATEYNLADEKMAGGLFRNYWYETVDTYNNLFVLKTADMETVGAVTGMAPGERIYSVRFDGAVGYMVTYKQVDPLFAVDLSNPTDPKVLSALKIPGFSTYMHPWGPDMLLGLGREDNKLKLSMFDVRDKTDVTEKHTYYLGADQSRWFDSEALSNHHAVLIDYARNLIGFPVYSTHNYSGNANRYYVFYAFENGAFTEKGHVQLPEGAYENIRGLYIDDYAYIITGERIISIDLSEFIEAARLEF